MSHTPAPWVYCQKWQKVTIADGGQLLADIRGWGWLQKLPDGEAIQDANGRLIAAAPDLLAELENLSAVMACHDKTPEENLALEAAKKAIAKARGESV